MLTKRIIPCLDVKDGLVVKGKNFKNLMYAGNAVSLAKKYNNDGADELVFLDITASNEKRKTIVNLVKQVAKEIFIPFTVGGGISTVTDIRGILAAGADKVSINTTAVKNPSLISEAAKQFGSQCIVVAIDAKKINGKFKVFIKSGKRPTSLDALSWAKKAQELGAGEILLTSIDQDGTKKGYDIELTKLISNAVTIPVIASGGAGSLADFSAVFKEGNADAALGASVFHYRQYTIPEVKKYLAKKQVSVRLC